MPIKVNSEKIFDFDWAKVFFTINLHNAHDSTTYLYDIGNNKKKPMQNKYFYNIQYKRDLWFFTNLIYMQNVFRSCLKENPTNQFC